ncbi:MAG: hypothetical protein AB7E05_08160 [Sphingobium sp.]
MRREAGEHAARIGANAAVILPQRTRIFDGFPTIFFFPAIYFPTYINHIAVSLGGVKTSGLKASGQGLNVRHHPAAPTENREGGAETVALSTIRGDNDAIEVKSRRGIYHANHVER